MAQEIIIFDRSYKAAATLNQYSAVALNSSANAAVATAGIPGVGVVQNGDNAVPGTVGTVASGAIAEVRVVGVTKWQAGSGGVTAGNLIAADGSGNAVAATTGAYILGVCEQSAASGALATVLLKGLGKV